MSVNIQIWSPTAEYICTHPQWNELMSPENCVTLSTSKILHTGPAWLPLKWGGQGTSAWFWVLSNTESYHPGDSREGSKPLLLPPQTQGMPRDVCQGVPKQPSGDCISLAGLTHTSPRKEYGRWFYRPVASELKMSPGALCRMGVLVTLGCGNISFLSVDMQLQVGQSRAEGSSPAVCQLVFVFFTLMGLEFPSNTLCCRA